MLASLGIESSALGVASLYSDSIDGFVLDSVDRSLEPRIRALGPRTLVTDTIIAGEAGRARLARAVMKFAASL